MNKKKIRLLTTGGTIASMPGGQGLEPHRSDVMELALEQLRSYYEIDVEDIMCLDSSNITPEQWQQIATRIFEGRKGVDGIVVSHGTDTMAYTASAVTFMLPDIDLPVVFTGLPAAAGRYAVRRSQQFAHRLCHGRLRLSRRIRGLRPKGDAGLPRRESARFRLFRI